MVHHIIRRT